MTKKSDTGTLDMTVEGRPFIVVVTGYGLLSSISQSMNRTLDILTQCQASLAQAKLYKGRLNPDPLFAQARRDDFDVAKIALKLLAADLRSAIRALEAEINTCEEAFRRYPNGEWAGVTVALSGDEQNLLPRHHIQLAKRLVEQAKSGLLNSDRFLSAAAGKAQSQDKRKRVMRNCTNIVLGDIIISPEFEFGKEDSEGVRVGIGARYECGSKETVTATVRGQSVPVQIDADVYKFDRSDPTRASAPFVVELAYAERQLPIPSMLVKARRLAAGGTYDPNGEVICFRMSGSYMNLIEEVELVGHAELRVVE